MAYFSDPKDSTSNDESKMVLAAKCGEWETVWTMLNTKPYLVNSIPKERAWGILHQAVWWKNQKAVERILKISGCDSELLTKNGLKPLDIATTRTIKKLLTNHIESNELSKTTIFLDEGNLIDENIPKMVLASKDGHWDTVKAILDKQPYLVNSTPKEMNWGILHHAVMRKDINAVEMLLKIPGCDSVMRSKNGTRPLDIDTTVEIKELLTDHIQSNETIKASFFLTSEDIATPPDGIYPDQLTDETLVSEEGPKVEELSVASKKGDWRKFFRILNFWGHLINVINPKTGMAPIHEAALAEDEKVITELMSYTACKLDVEAKEPAKGAGKTAAQITVSTNVKKSIHCKLEEQKKSYNNEIPTYVDIQSAQLNLMCYIQGAMDNNEICEKTHNHSYYESFPAMEEKIFSFINTGDNWISVRNIVANEVGRIDASERTIINDLQDKTAFFIYLIKLYTKNTYYPALNSHLRRHPLELPDVTTEIEKKQKSYRVYTAITNAVLFHAKLGPRFSKKTYRGVSLSGKDLQNYQKVGTRFAWLSFTSSSRNKQDAFHANCRFIINNEMECAWSPRGIEKNSASPSEHEYLYPCGAHFEVTKVKIRDQNLIYLKLISSPIVSQPIQLVYKEEKLHYDTLVAQYNQIYSPLLEEKNLVDATSAELHTLYLRVENLKTFETEVVESSGSKKIDLPKGMKAFHCRDCNTTCDYPCHETHMSLGRCKFCIPRAGDACTKCQGGCHFTKHFRVGYRLQVELVTTTLVDEEMKAEYAVALAEFQSRESVYKSMKESWEKDVMRLPKGIQLIEDMQKSIQIQTNILNIEENNTWDNYDEILIQLSEYSCFFEECRYQLREWELL